MPDAYTDRMLKPTNLHRLNRENCQKMTKMQKKSQRLAQGNSTKLLKNHITCICLNGLRI